MQIKRKIKTEIITQTLERKIFYFRKSINTWCEFCQVEVKMVSPEQAAGLLGLNVREIYRRIESGKLHFFESDNGEIFVCTASADNVNP